MKPLVSQKQFNDFKRSVIPRGNPNLVILDRCPRLKASAFAKQLNGKNRVRVAITFEHDGRKFTQPFILIRKRRGCTKVCYFICPVTSKAVCQLYFIHGRYVSKDGCKGFAMYYRQTLNEKKRLALQSRINPLNLPEVDLTHPTKRGLRTLKKIAKARAKRLLYLAKYPKK
jgi:hypothetical protein